MGEDQQGLYGSEKMIFDPFTAPIDTNPFTSLLAVNTQSYLIGFLDEAPSIPIDYIPLMFLIFQGISIKSVALT